MESIKNKIFQIEKKLNIKIPIVYKEYLANTNGEIFNHGVLYSVNEIEERYRTLEFADYAPDYLSIGNDNGDYELVMRTEESCEDFGILEQGAIGSIEPQRWQNFREWYNNGCSFEFCADEKFDISKKVTVTLKKLPNEKSTLLKIRKALHLETPISILLSTGNNLPYVLTDRLSYAQVKKIIDKENLSEWLDIIF